MLHTCNKVVSCEVCYFTTLGVNPLNAFTELIGYCYIACIRIGIGEFAVSECESGLKRAFCIVLKKPVVCVDDGFGVSGSGGCENVPCLRVAGVAVCVRILKCVALVCKVLLSPSFVFACALEFSPLSLHLSSVFGGDDVGCNKNLMISLIVVAPE